MATMIWPSATRSPRAVSRSREGWFHILRKRNELGSSEAIQSYAERLKSGLLLHSQVPALAPVEDNAGDDEHRRHRQHLRKRLRGRPFGGFLHAFSLAHDPPKCGRFGVKIMRVRLRRARSALLGRTHR